MKVKDLIEDLQKLNEDAEVRVMEESGCYEYPIINIDEDAGDVRIEFRDED